MDKYINRSDFNILKTCSRVDAIKQVWKASCLLLVQHTEKCSVETIPYKTYDYLNLRLPIFSFIDKNELWGIIQSSGNFASKIDSIDSIKCSLKICLSELDKFKRESHCSFQELDISQQFLQVLE